MSVQVLVITINNHKSIRISIRRSIITYINIDVSINTGISISNTVVISNSICISTTVNNMICIRRYVCIHILLAYMKSTNISIHECVNKVCVF